MSQVVVFMDWVSASVLALLLWHTAYGIPAVGYGL